MITSYILNFHLVSEWIVLSCKG